MPSIFPSASFLLFCNILLFKLLITVFSGSPINKASALCFPYVAIPPASTPFKPPPVTAPSIAASIILYLISFHFVLLSKVNLSTYAFVNSVPASVPASPRVPPTNFFTIGRNPFLIISFAASKSLGFIALLALLNNPAVYLSNKPSTVPVNAEFVIIVPKLESVPASISSLNLFPATPPPININPGVPYIAAKVYGADAKNPLTVISDAAS